MYGKKSQPSHVIVHRLLSNLKSQSRMVSDFIYTYRQIQTFIICAGQKLPVSRGADNCWRVYCYFSPRFLLLVLLYSLEALSGEMPSGNKFVPHLLYFLSPGFMTYIVEPLFERWAQFTGDTPLSENMLNHLRRNKAKWRSLLHKQHSSSRSNDHSGQVTGSQEQTLNEEETPQWQLCTFPYSTAISVLITAASKTPGS